MVYIVFFIAQSHAQQDRLINFQGRLTDQQGNYLDGSFDIIFNIYDSATDTKPKWTEIHKNASVSKGLINVLLGSIEPFNTLTFDKPRYLGVIIDTDGKINTEEPEMLPRQQILPAIYSYDADKLDGKDGSEYTIPTTDAGRIGVVEDLYEGYTKLADKYTIIPKGGVIIYSGAWNFDSTGLGIESLKGWALCNGNNGTPDLKDRFVMSANTSPDLNTTGGSNFYTLSVSNLPSHTHSFTTNKTGNHSHNIRAGWYGGTTPIVHDKFARSDSVGERTPITTETTGAHSHSGRTDSTGGGNSIDNRPSFIRLAYIMKL